jgi:hypothetical protein
MNDFVHCSLSMTNIVVDYSGKICLCNFDQCVYKIHRIARVGGGHYEYSAPETMMQPRQLIYEMVEYKINIDCFAVGVMAWDLATGIHAFADVQKDSYRKMLKLSKLWVQLSEGDPNDNIMKYITEIMDIPFESKPNRLGSLSCQIALLLCDEKNQLSAERIFKEFNEENNLQRRQLWFNILTVHGLSSLIECNFGHSAGESPWQNGIPDFTGSID